MFRLAIFYQNAGETQNDTLPFSLLLKSPPPVVNVCAGKSHSVTRIFITNVLDRSQENHSVEDRPQVLENGAPEDTRKGQMEDRKYWKNPLRCLGKFAV